MSKETKSLIKDIKAQLRVIENSHNVLENPSPNMNGEQKESLLKSTKDLVENIIEDLEQLKVSIGYDKKANKPVNSFGKGKK
jgi:hypothetical protein